MRIGIVSDSHGDVDRLRRAMEIFDAHDVEVLVHCGDVGSPDCLEVLADGDCDVHVVAGNTDHHVEDLVAAAAKFGVHFAWEVVEIDLGDGRHLVATHGHDDKILGELIHDAQFPYVCCGHSHKTRDETVDGVRVINPGAIHNARLHTVAVLDTDTGHLEHVIVPD